MTDHVMHMCSVFGKAEVHKTRLGWQHDELPLNKLRHTKCPYCGEPTENMKPASGSDVATLSTDPQSKSYLRGGGHGSRQSDFSSELLDEVKKLRKEMQEIRDGKPKPTEREIAKDTERMKDKIEADATTKENEK